MTRRSRVLIPTEPQLRSTRKQLRMLAGSLPAKADTVILGDSLAVAWPASLLSAVFVAKTVFNFGVPGERIQNTLWRLKALGTAHLRPEAVVLFLGTNNLGDGDPPGEVAVGIAQVIETAARLWGSPKFLLITVPRRWDAREHESERLMLNESLRQRYERDRKVCLVEADGVLDPAARHIQFYEADGLHLAPEAYKALTRQLAIVVAQTPEHWM